MFYCFDKVSFKIILSFIRCGDFVEEFKQVVGSRFGIFILILLRWLVSKSSK
jgi:hypothetical protein